MLANSEWSAIKASSRRIANEFAGIPLSNRQRNARITKLYYRTYHMRELDQYNAITRLEAEQPLLKLCAANWKAEHKYSRKFDSSYPNERKCKGQTE